MLKDKMSFLPSKSVVKGHRMELIH